MTQDLNQQSQSSLNRYRSFLRELERIPQLEKYAPYDWANEPNNFQLTWLVYVEQMREFARELANEINHFNDGIRRLAAWANVVKDLNDDQKLEIRFEFIMSLATYCLGAPYAIQSKLAYSTVHLCHQANRTFGPWQDNLKSDKGIYVSTVQEYAKCWQSYKEFKPAIEAIASDNYQLQTNDFRHSYNHRFQVGLIYGYTGLITRVVEKDKGAVNYTIGEREPLQLDHLVSVLRNESDLIFKAFDCFKLLVNEQLGAISTYDNSGVQIQIGH